MIVCEQDWEEARSQVRERVPVLARPDWLKPTAVEAPLPITELLINSVYYPASGMDSDPVMHLGHHFWSFVYADYGYSSEFISDTLGASVFAGYELLGRRSIAEDQVPLTRWNSESSGWLAGCNNRQARERATPPFAEWALLKRDYGQDSPPELMSLLFVGADGVTLFKKLFAENEIKPACIVIIQPGDGMGDQNWTNFNNPNDALAKAVMNNPAGSPRFLLYGGNGKAEWYNKSCWPAYGRCLAWPLERKINRGEANAPGYHFRGNRTGALSLWESTA